MFSCHADVYVAFGAQSHIFCYVNELSIDVSVSPSPRLCLLFFSSQSSTLGCEALALLQRV